MPYANHEDKLSNCRVRMRDKPIIFSAPMVRALLDGRKTQTRRLAWQEPQVAIQTSGGSAEPIMVPTLWQRVKPGDRLWVRETLCQHGHFGFPLAACSRFTATGERIWSYAADGIGDETNRRPSIHMPRWASRLTLIVTATKIEPLHAISEDDARLEGIPEPYLGDADPPWEEQAVRVSRWMQFRNLWKRLHGVASWDANPEVVALTFTVHRGNIDALSEAA